MFKYGYKLLDAIKELACIISIIITTLGFLLCMYYTIDAMRY